MTLRILDHHEPQGWWPESPDLDGWSPAEGIRADTRRLAADGVRLAMACGAEDHGMVQDKQHYVSIVVEQFAGARDPTGCAA